jgi:hypothetical protein
VLSLEIFQGSSYWKTETIFQAKSDPVEKGAGSPRKDQSSLSKRFRMIRPPRNGSMRS